jgi:predicted nuclease of predicted toxin-antitoxin system
VKFLIDECLSPALAQTARSRGFRESMHVTWLGMRSRKDWTVARRAVDDGFVFVTNNAVDFTPLYSAVDLHAGLVCIAADPGQMNLALQKRLFVLALDELGADEPYNELIEIIAGADDQVRLRRYQLARGSGRA